MEMTLPDWLQPESLPIDKSAKKELELITFANMFPQVCDQLANDIPLSEILGRDPRSPDVAKFMRWIMRDEVRKEQYYEALAIAAEVTFVEDMVRIADAVDSLEDEKRSRIRLETRWKKMAICNKDRFGDTKKFEQTINIDIGEAMERARQRVVDVTPRYDDE